MVAADALDRGAIINALKEGRHYSTTGPELRSLELDGSRLVVECSPVDRIHVAGAGHLSRCEYGDGITRATLELGGYQETSFFRVTIVDSAGRRAWSNPYFPD